MTIDRQQSTVRSGSPVAVNNGKGTGSIDSVGKTLRRWRREAGLSIREVAERSGLSVSFISLFERGRTEIALSRLLSLANVFNRDVSDLLREAYGEEREQAALKEPAGETCGRTYHLAGGIEIAYLGDAKWHTQPWLFALEPDAVHGPLMHAWREVVVCVHGELTMVIDGKSSTMAAGDSITVSPNAHHAYMNTGPATCRFLAVDALADDPRVLLETWDQMERAGKTGRWRDSVPHTDSPSITDEET